MNKVSKFEEELKKDKKDKIVDALKNLVANKKDDEKVELEVKVLKGLMADLEDLEVKKEEKPADEKEEKAGEEKKDDLGDDYAGEEEKKDGEEKKEGEDKEGKEGEEGGDKDGEDKDAKDKKPAESNAEGGDAEGKDKKDGEAEEEEEEETSKLAQALGLAEKYKLQCEKSGIINKKLEQKVSKLESQNKELKSEISKFKEIEKSKRVSKYNALLDDTVSKYAQLHGLDEKGMKAKKEEWRMSKMTVGALKELGTVLDGSVSKLSAPINTQPSEYLNQPDPEPETMEQAMSKMSNEAKMKFLAQVGAAAHEKTRLGE